MYIWTKPAQDPIHIPLSVQSNLIAAWYFQLSITARNSSTPSMSVGSVPHTQSDFHSTPMIRAVLLVSTVQWNLSLSLWQRLSIDHFLMHSSLRKELYVYHSFISSLHRWHAYRSGTSTKWCWDRSQLSQSTSLSFWNSRNVIKSSWRAVHATSVCRLCIMSGMRWMNGTHRLPYVGMSALENGQ